MKPSPDFILGAGWALNKILIRLPISKNRTCDCSADVVSFIDDIHKEIKKMQEVTRWKEGK